MNYVERLLESQFASDELKDYLDRTHKKGNPKLGQKYKVAINGEKNKDVNRRAKGLQNAPNSHRFAVQLNSKLKFNHINAIAQPDGKYRNLIWIMHNDNGTHNNLIDYLSEFLGLSPNSNNYEIGEYQIRIADIRNAGVKNYFTRQNGVDFMKSVEDKLDNGESNYESKSQEKEEAPEENNTEEQQAEEPKDQDNSSEETPKEDNSSDYEEDTRTPGQVKHDKRKLDYSLEDDEYREDVIGWDKKKKKPIYKRWSKGWWAQRGERAREAGWDSSKWNLDPTTWKMSQGLTKL